MKTSTTSNDSHVRHAGRRGRAVLWLVALTVPTCVYAIDDAAVARCAAIDDDRARLACFDALARTLQSAETPTARSSEVAPVQQPRTAAVPRRPASVPVVESTPRNNPASDVASAPTPGPTTALVTARRQLWPSERWVFVLDNGDVWEQTKAKRVSIRVDDRVRVIERGMGFLMIDEGGASTRVRPRGSGRD